MAVAFVDLGARERGFAIEAVEGGAAVVPAGVAVDAGLRPADVAEEDAGLAVAASVAETGFEAGAGSYRVDPASSSPPSMSPVIRSRTGSGDWEREAGGCETGEEVERMETGEEEVPLRLRWVGVRGGGTLWAWTRARSSWVRVCTGIEMGRERGALCDGGRISAAIVVVGGAGVVFAKHRQLHTRPQRHYQQPVSHFHLEANAFTSCSLLQPTFPFSIVNILFFPNHVCMQP